VEVHPFFPQRALRAFCHRHGILVQAYSSLGQSDASLRDHPVVKEVATRRNMSPAQVLLR
jgi:glycerol 2-dehydrogenase (NADP+)